jgi:hypothetical protein
MREPNSHNREVMAASMRKRITRLTVKVSSIRGPCDGDANDERTRRRNTAQQSASIPLNKLPPNTTNQVSTPKNSPFGFPLQFGLFGGTSQAKISFVSTQQGDELIIGQSCS